MQLPDLSLLQGFQLTLAALALSRGPLLPQGVTGLHVVGMLAHLAQDASTLDRLVEAIEHALKRLALT
jgi:hypothetical protein